MGHRSRIRRLEKRHASEAKPKIGIPADPIAFARCLNLEPDPWQRDLLTSTEEHIILNCSRQSGKSTIVAVLALHHALTNPGALVLILSPSQRQSGELLKKVITFYRELRRPGGTEADSTATLELRNGSRIVALLGQSRPPGASAGRLSSFLTKPRRSPRNSISR